VARLVLSCPDVPGIYWDPVAQECTDGSVVYATLGISETELGVFAGPSLTPSDVADILSATLLVFAVVASVRFVYRTIVNR
jgi:hypothetical protein